MALDGIEIIETFTDALCTPGDSEEPTIKELGLNAEPKTSSCLTLIEYYRLH